MSDIDRTQAGMAARLSRQGHRDDAPHEPQDSIPGLQAPAHVHPPPHHAPAKHADSGHGARRRTAPRSLPVSAGSPWLWRALTGFYVSHPAAVRAVRGLVYLLVMGAFNLAINHWRAVPPLGLASDNAIVLGVLVAVEAWFDQTYHGQEQSQPVGARSGQ